MHFSVFREQNLSAVTHAECAVSHNECGIVGLCTDNKKNLTLSIVFANALDRETDRKNEEEKEDLLLPPAVSL